MLLTAHFSCPTVEKIGMSDQFLNNLTTTLLFIIKNYQLLLWTFLFRYFKKHDPG